MRVLSGGIIAIGLLLAIGGAYALVTGAPYIQLEFGWAKVIAGTTALSAGIVTIALGAIHLRLDALARAMQPARPSTIVGARSLEPTRGVIPTLEPADSLAPSEPVAVGADGDADGDGGRLAVPAPSRRAEPQMEPRVTPAPLAATPTRVEPAPPLVETEPHPLLPATEPADGSQVFHRVGIEDVVERPAAERAVIERAVVGRYESNGAHYVLFSDGTIEVTTETGARRVFASMEELREFVERQETGREPAEP